MKDYRIINGIIVQADQLLSDHVVVVKNHVIVDITSDKNKYNNLETIDAQGNYISPGLVELHIHGCSRFGFDQLKQLDMNEVVTFLGKRGINTFTPTFQCNREVIKEFTKLISGTKEFSKNIPGIYIEGPFINPQKKGGIGEEYISNPDTNLLQQIISECKGLLKLMTLAPEIPNSEKVLNMMSEEGLIPCLGHSGAGIADITIPEKTKVNITHLFNAMSPVSHRKSGLAMLPFLNKEVFFELNADGVHVNDEAVQMSYNSLNKDRCILISDAVISSGLDYGEYESYGRTIISNENGVRYKADNVLMGSNLLINDILKRFLNLTKAPLYEGIRFASTNPFKLLGMGDKRGSIEIGKEADIILLNKTYDVVLNLFVQ